MINSLESRSDKNEVLERCLVSKLDHNLHYEYRTMSVDKLFNHNHLGHRLWWNDPSILKELAEAVGCGADYHEYFILLHAHSTDNNVKKVIVPKNGSQHFDVETGFKWSRRKTECNNDKNPRSE